MPGPPPDLLPPRGMRHALLAAAFAAARLLPKGRSTFASLAHRLLGCPRRIVADLGGQRFAVDMRDRHTALAAALAGIYEPAATAVFLKLLRPGARVLDIGANKGYFSLLAAARIGDAGTVISYEPLAENAADIEATRDLGAFANWQVVRAAVSDAPGEVAFADSGWAQGIPAGAACARTEPCASRPSRWKANSRGSAGRQRMW
ncbi:MAG: FkbM family methyltransferase [Verrucomicrobiales bacterium]